MFGNNERTAGGPGHREDQSPVDDALDLRILLHLLLLQPTLAVLQAVLILHQDLARLLLLREEPVLVFLKLAVRHFQPLLQRMNFLLVLPHLKEE